MTKFLFLAALSSAAAGAQAAFIIHERTSSLDVFYTYGGGADVFPGSNGASSTSLNSENLLHISGEDMNSGFTEFGTWAGGVNYDLNQEFSPTANGIYGASDIGLNSFMGGDGFSNIDGRNELTVLFTNTATTAITLDGASTSNAFYSLDVFDGLGWTSVFTSPGMGGFSFTGTILPGEYRLQGIGSATATNQMSQGAAWSYNFAAVPEPSIMAGLGLGVIALLRRRRR